MNNDLKTAFAHVACGRTELNHIIEEPGFHNQTWQDAFTQTFDQIEKLKQASDRDAATLGSFFIDVIGSLINQLIEEPGNRISRSMLCMMMSYADHGLNEARRHFEYTLRDLDEQYVPVYTVKMDARLPYALVLETADAKKAEKWEGYYNARELHENLRSNFGPDIKQLPASKFQAELERRLVHTPEVVVLLQKNGDLLGQDLSKHFVYGSPMHPMDSSWARVDAAAVYIRCNKQSTGYHSYVAVPAKLDQEILARYELEFISHP